MSSLVIGVGNEYRRDDGVGIAVARQLVERKLAGVEVMTAIGEPGAILDAWSVADVVVAVDAAAGDGATPGRMRRWTPENDVEHCAVSSHSLGLPQTYALGAALGRAPRRLVVLTVDVADVTHGVGLTPAVAAAIPGVVGAVIAELAWDSQAGNVRPKSLPPSRFRP